MKGTYTLLVDIPGDVRIEVGMLGELDFKEGSYAYVGSALRNLESRIDRHYREEKNLHWHIDYLLLRGNIERVVYGEGEDRKECAVAENLSETLESIKGFGSSDCGCGSHLFYSEEFTDLEEKVISSFEKSDLKPEVW